MATKSKRSKSKWFQGKAMKPLLAIVVIAVFSVIGVVYINSSKAATIYPYSEVAGIDKMTPGSNTAQQPYKINEVVPVFPPSKYLETVWHLPATPVNKSAWVESTFKAKPTKGYSYQACAMVRRDPRATTSQPLYFSLGSPANPSSLDKTQVNLKGSTSYDPSGICGNLYLASSSSSAPITIRISNSNSYGVNVEQIDLQINPPQTAARCYQALVAPSGVGTCQHFPVTTGGYPQPGYCYTLQLASSSQSLVYAPADCSKPPFGAISTP